LTSGRSTACLLGWAWIVLRLGIMALAAGWLLVAWRRARADDTTRRRQLFVTFATVVVGAIGGGIRLVFGPGNRAIRGSACRSSPWPWCWPPRSYSAAPCSSRPEVCRPGLLALLRAGGSSAVAFVGIVIVADAVSRDLLGLEVPLVSAVALTLTIALVRAAPWLGQGTASATRRSWRSLAGAS